MRPRRPPGHCKIVLCDFHIKMLIGSDHPQAGSLGDRARTRNMIQKAPRSPKMCLFDFRAKVLKGRGHPLASLPEQEIMTLKGSTIKIVFDLHIKILIRSNHPQALYSESERLT